MVHKGSQERVLSAYEIFGKCLQITKTYHEHYRVLIDRDREVDLSRINISDSQAVSNNDHLKIRHHITLFNFNIRPVYPLCLAEVEQPICVQLYSCTLGCKLRPLRPVVNIEHPGRTHVKRNLQFSVRHVVLS